MYVEHWSFKGVMVRTVAKYVCGKLIVKTLLIATVAKFEISCTKSVGCHG